MDYYQEKPARTWKAQQDSKETQDDIRPVMGRSETE